MKNYLSWLCLLLLFAQSTESARLASLDWPPYTGAALQQQGETTVLLKQVFAAIGLDVQIEFLPWSRAIRASEKSVCMQVIFRNIKPLTKI